MNYKEIEKNDGKIVENVNATINQPTLEVTEVSGNLPVFEEKDWNEYLEIWLHPKTLQSNYPLHMGIQLRDECEGDDDEAEDTIRKNGYRYTAEIIIVSPEWARHSIHKDGSTMLDSILESSGIDNDDLEELKEDPEFLLQEMVSQGYYATVWNNTGNDRKELLKEAIKQSVSVKAMVGFYLDKPQNGMGATGWDILTNNPWGANCQDQCEYTLKDSDEVYERKMQEREPNATPITNPNDAFKVPDMSSLDTEDIEKATGLTHVETLFVDSSGFGSVNEPALSVKQFEKKITELLTEYTSLFGAITGIGQFQIYVSIFKGGN